MISFSQKYKRVGIDIGSFSIKAVALERGALDKRQAISYAIEYLPVQTSASSFQISESIQRALKRMDITTPKVNISVFGPEVVFRYLLLPLVRKSEIINALKLEWDKYISFKLDEVIWDFQVLDTISTATQGKQRLILLAAAKKEFLEQQTHLLKEAGVEPGIIDTNVTCLVNAFNFLHSFESRNSLLALMNIGELVTNLIILKDGIPRFSRDILFGGRDITHLIAQKKHIDFLEAQGLKHNFNGGDEEITSIIKNSLSNLINEINLSFEYLKQELGEQARAIYISGGSLRLYGIEELLSQGLQVKLKTWKSNGNLCLSRRNSRKDLEECFPELVVAMGAALAR